MIKLTGHTWPLVGVEVRISIWFDLDLFGFQIFGVKNFSFIQLFINFCLGLNTRLNYFKNFKIHIYFTFLKMYIKIHKLNI